MKKMKILVAEDEPDIANQYKIELETRYHKVTIAQDGEECMRIYLDKLSATDLGTPFDVVLLDYRMPKRDGIEVAKEILNENPNQRIIFASAYVKDTLIDSVKQLNRIVEIMEKPFPISVFAEIVEDEKIMLEMARLNAKFKRIRGREPTPEELSDFLRSLRKMQGLDAWYSVSDIKLG